jgi:glycine cleavage system H protein
MDGFTYHNIFQTKGIEYIVIIIFLILLVPFWIIINKRAQIKNSIRSAFSFLTKDGINVPKGIFFSKNHTWTHLERSGQAKVGVNDLLVRLTGDVHLQFIKNPDDEVNKGDLIASIKQDGKSLKLYSPISGTVTHTNALCHETPGVLNEDPYGKGWIYEIRPTNWVDETKSYYLADDAFNWASSELQRFKDFFAGTMARQTSMPENIILQDGGELRNNTLSELPVEVWIEFQEEFLSKTG